jgi:hypothetical protein
LKATTCHLPSLRIQTSRKLYRPVPLRPPSVLADTSRAPRRDRRSSLSCRFVSRRPTGRRNPPRGAARRRRCRRAARRRSAPARAGGSSRGRRPRRRCGTRRTRKGARESRRSRARVLAGLPASRSSFVLLS